MRGGGKEYIGDLAPEITDATSLMANCNCYYISAHGSTNLGKLHIVPEKTFIIFIGSSGFQTPVQHGAEWLFYAPTAEEYFQNIYDTYFKAGASQKKRPYAGEHVYVPGDILPVTNLSFTSGLQPFWFKGLFQCPVEHPNMFNLPDKMAIVIQYAELSKPGALKDPTAYLSLQQAITDFGEVKDQDAWNAFVALTLADKVREITLSPEKGRLAYWFKNPDSMTGFSDYYLYRHQKNLNLRLNSSGASQSLPNLLYRNFSQFQNYRFIIVSSCRQPTNFVGPQISIANRNARYSAINPEGLPANTNSTRRLARRFSFSGKPAEICATTDDPPMNILKVKETLYKLRPPRITNATPNIEVGIKEDIFLDELLSTLFIQFGPTVLEGIPTELFIDVCINRSFAKYPILEDETPAQQEKRRLFTNLITEIKSAFGAFLAGIHMDSKLEEKRAHTLGHQLLDQARLLRLEVPTQNEANILAAQKAFVEDPKWKVLVPVKEPSMSEKIDALIKSIERDMKFYRLTTEIPLFLKMDIFNSDEEYLYLGIKEGVELQEKLNAFIIEFNTKINEAMDALKVLETSAKTAQERSEIAHVKTLGVGEAKLAQLKEFKRQLDERVEKYQKKEKELAEAKAKAKKNEEQAKLAVKPIVQSTAIATQPKWNEKELLKWRVEWLMGIRNPARNDARLKQWSAYRATLTEAERRAQNANLKKRATRKNKPNNRNVRTMKKSFAPGNGGGGRSATYGH